MTHVDPARWLRAPRPVWFPSTGTLTGAAERGSLVQGGDVKRAVLLLSLAGCASQLYCDSSCDTSGVVVQCYTDADLSGLTLHARQQPSGSPVSANAGFIGFVEADEVPDCLDAPASVDQHWRGQLASGQLGEFTCGAVLEVAVEPEPAGSFQFTGCDDTLSLGTLDD
jgi:hypothetical protein